MAKTPIGNTVSYLPAAEFLKRYDQRTVGELCSDGQQQGAVPPGALPGNVNLLAALADASGYFESAVLKGERYTLADLQAMPPGSPGQGLMYRIIASIAMACLFERRPSYPQEGNPTEQAVTWLNRLAAGDSIFPFQETAAAGLLEPLPDTTQDVERRNGISFITRDLLGRRANRWDRPW